MVAFHGMTAHTNPDNIHRQIPPVPIGKLTANDMPLIVTLFSVLYSYGSGLNILTTTSPKRLGF